MNTRKTAHALPGGRVPNAITYGIRPDPIGAQLSDILATVMACESAARRTPFTWQSAVLPRRRS